MFVMTHIVYPWIDTETISHQSMTDQQSLMFESDNVSELKQMIFVQLCTSVCAQVTCKLQTLNILQQPSEGL